MNIENPLLMFEDEIELFANFLILLLIYWFQVF
jgi:hypothetical protein